MACEGWEGLPPFKGDGGTIFKQLHFGVSCV